MPNPRQADLDALIAALIDAGVEFVVVGGAAAVLHGAPIATVDLDIVHRRSPENVERLLALLSRLEATVREPANRGLRPTAELLLGRGQNLLSTALGPLDLLGVLHDQRGYEELLPKTEILSDGALEIRVLDLNTLIEVKADAGRAKDRLVLPILLALRDRDDRDG
jgi:hypothetical protein